MASPKDPYVGRLVRVLETALERTRRGSAEWTVVEGSPDEYDLNLPHGIISVVSESEGGRPPYRAEFYNSEGAMVESIRSLVNPSTPDEEQFNFLLYDLYEAARRSSLQIDAVLNALLADLSD